MYSIFSAAVNVTALENQKTGLENTLTQKEATLNGNYILKILDYIYRKI